MEASIKKRYLPWWETKDSNKINNAQRMKKEKDEQRIKDIGNSINVSKAQEIVNYSSIFPCEAQLMPVKSRKISQRNHRRYSFFYTLKLCSIGEWGIGKDGVLSFFGKFTKEEDRDEGLPIITPFPLNPPSAIHYILSLQHHSVPSTQLPLETETGFLFETQVNKAPSSFSQRELQLTQKSRIQSFST